MEEVFRKCWNIGFEYENLKLILGINAFFSGVLLGDITRQVATNGVQRYL